jgi:sugar phosphate isomerase/epimerase
VSVELALTPDSRWGAHPADLVPAAAAAGFAAVGLGVEYARDGGADALAAGGLRCHELLALRVSRNEEKTLESAHRLAGAADAVRAEWVLTVLTVPPSAETAELLARCADIVAGSGARLAIEFSPLGPVTSLAAAHDLARAAAPGRLGVLVDTWHFCRGDSTWEQLEQVPLDAIAYVQFDDAPEPVSADGFDETMNRRVWPGLGSFELERFASTLVDRGWEGTVSVEVLNAELAHLPVADFAQAAYDSTAPYWR